MRHAEQLGRVAKSGWLRSTRPHDHCDTSCGEIIEPPNAVDDGFASLGWNYDEGQNAKAASQAAAAMWWATSSGTPTAGHRIERECPVYAQKLNSSVKTDATAKSPCHVRNVRLGVQQDCDPRQQHDTNEE